MLTWITPISSSIDSLKILRCKFIIQVIGALWILSLVGSWFSFWTLVYLGQYHLSIVNLFKVCSEFIREQVLKSKDIENWTWKSDAGFLMLHTAPVLYEKYEVHVDSMAEKALLEFNKHYAAFYEKVLRKIPRGPLWDRKQDWDGGKKMWDLVTFSYILKPGFYHLSLFLCLLSWSLEALQQELICNSYQLFYSNALSVNSFFFF